jgi:hypothetical protein
MPKITTRDLYDYKTSASGARYIPAQGGRAQTIRRTYSSRLSSNVWVGRTGGTGAKSFEACVEIGSFRRPGVKRASGYTTSCMFGSNPRAALAAALSRAARQMKKRSGAFARYR